MKFNQIADKKDGKFIYDKDRMNKLTATLTEGRYLITIMKLNPLSEIKEYRACYFVKLDTLCKDAGETRYDMHEYVKKEILQSMLDESPQVFDGCKTLSTKCLNKDGWYILLDRLDIWAFINYNVILQ